MRTVTATLVPGEVVLGAVVDSRQQFGFVLICGCQTKFFLSYRSIGKFINLDNTKRKEAKVLQADHTPRIIKCPTCTEEDLGRQETKPREESIRFPGRLYGRSPEPRTPLAKEAVRLLKAGASVKEVAIRMDVAWSTVDVWRLRWIVEPRMKELEAKYEPKTKDR